MLKLSVLFSFMIIFHVATASPRYSNKDFRNSPQNVRYGEVKGPGDINLGPVTNFNCPSGKTIAANPDDCAQYYTCYVGEPVYLWQCYSNYRFDLTYDGCNFPQNVQCGSRPINPLTPPPSTTPAPPPFTCPSPNGFFGIPGQCGSQYYVCVDGVPFVSSCPGTTIFDPVTLLCSSESNTSCKNFKCPGPSGFFPVTPDACIQSYFICFDNEATLTNCPGVSFFEPSTKSCLVNAPCRNNRIA